MLAPKVSRKLVTRERFRSIRENASALGEGFTSCYLECRMGRKEARVDYMACLPLASARKAIRNRPFLAGWPQARRFVTAWTRKEGMLGKGIPRVWLSFDLDRAGKAWPEPSLLVGLGAGNRRDPGGLSREIFRTLENVFPRQVEAAALSLLDSLPATARVLHLSLMPGRKPSAVKANLLLPRQDLPGFLSRGGWRGPGQDLRQALDSGLLPARVLKMQVTAGRLLDSRLEFEVQFSGSDSRAALVPWLRRCGEMGLGDPGKLAELVSWPGFSFGRTQGHALLVERRLDMKVIVGAGPGLQVKAYLGMAQASGK